MTDEQYRAYKRLLKKNIGTVVVDLPAGEERLRLSKHKYADQHETVVEAALWVLDDNLSKYKTYIMRELDSGGGGHGSIVNSGAYCETRSEAIEWLEGKATEYGGSELGWESRDRSVVDSSELGGDE